MTSSKGSRPTVHLFDLLRSLPPLAPGVGVLGETVAGEPLLLDLTVPETAHVLITGEHAVGKTTLLRSFATSLALLSRQAEIQMVLVDTDLGGGNDSAGTLQLVSYLPHSLADMIVTVEDAQAVLRFLLAESVYRGEQGVSRPHIVLFVDHLLPLLVEGAPFVADALQQLLQQGAPAGIHLVVATRRSHSAPLAPLLQEAWPVRLEGVAQTSGTNGSSTSVAEFLASLAEARVRFRAANVDDSDLEAYLQELRRQRTPALIAHPLDR